MFENGSDPDGIEKNDQLLFTTSMYSVGLS